MGRHKRDTRRVGPGAITPEDYELALTLAERDIVELEAALDAAHTETARLRERLSFVERELAFRRQHSNTFTYLGVQQHGRITTTE